MKTMTQMIMDNCHLIILMAATWLRLPMEPLFMRRGHEMIFGEEAMGWYDSKNE